MIKGYRIRNALLCQPIPPPPASAKVVTPDLSPDLSTREVIERLTERSGTSCLGCHGSLLNAMGFATENFDSLGRHRTAQRLFNSDGSSHGERPIDTSGVPHLAGVETPVAGIAEVTSLMLKGDFQTCFARQYFRFTFQRNEDDVQDSCALAELQTGALSNAPLSELMLSPVLRPEFVTRTIQ